MGYDLIRVHYRKQRWALLQKIIENVLVGEELKEFIDSETQYQIPEEDRDSFLEDIVNSNSISA